MTELPIDTPEVDMTDTRTVVEKAAAEQQLAEVIRMKNAGHTFQQIGDHFGFSRQHAHALFWGAMKSATKQEVADYRQAALGRIEDQRRLLNEVQARTHLAVSQGRVVVDPDTGAPLIDDQPKIAASRVLVSWEDRESKLLGLDTPVKQEIGLDGQLNYVINGVDVRDLA